MGLVGPRLPHKRPSLLTDESTSTLWQISKPAEVKHTMKVVYNDQLARYDSSLDTILFCQPCLLHKCILVFKKV